MSFSRFDSDSDSEVDVDVDVDDDQPQRSPQRLHHHYPRRRRKQYTHKNPRTWYSNNSHVHLSTWIAAVLCTASYIADVDSNNNDDGNMRMMKIFTFSEAASSVRTRKETSHNSSRRRTTITTRTTIGRSWKDIELFHGGSDNISTNYLFPERLADSIEDDPFVFPPNDNTDRDSIIQRPSLPQSRPMGENDDFNNNNNNNNSNDNDNNSDHRDPDTNNDFVVTSTRAPAAVFIPPTNAPTIDPLAIYHFPDNSIEPLRRPNPTYFNYHVANVGDNGGVLGGNVATATATTAKFGPGHPVGVYNSRQGFYVEYDNNRWTDAFTPDVWQEFTTNAGYGPWKSTLDNHRMFQTSTNQCSSGKQQSPIDIRNSGVACVEHHQIRTRRGDFRVAGKAITKQILPSKLRLLYQRRPCADYDNVVCSEPDPPHADFPNGWGGFADLLWVDFKFPAEHRIYGETFDGELQLYHIHSGRRRLPVVSILIRVAVQDDQEGGGFSRSGGSFVDYGHNSHLQAAIDAFQYEYDENKAQCANSIMTGKRKHRQRKRQRRRNLMDRNESSATLKTERTKYGRYEYENNNEDEEGDDDTNDDDDDNDDELLLRKVFGTQSEFTRYNQLFRNETWKEESQEHHRRLTSGIWDPYHKDIMPTYYFYGYDGSLTEPPCSEIVSWFVMDTPMTISQRQLAQLQHILFTNVDPTTCQSTSVHFDRSVARPIQETHGRQVWQCTREDYVPDHERST